MTAPTILDRPRAASPRAPHAGPVEPDHAAAIAAHDAGRAGCATTWDAHVEQALEQARDRHPSRGQR